MGHYLRELIQKHKAGIRLGIFSVCSANEFVLESLLEFGRKHDQAVLIEATSNQVNQYGGYTGMVPRDFVEFVAGIAAKAGFPKDRVILGGDHLGPNPWRQEPAAEAMAKAEVLVQEYLSLIHILRAVQVWSRIRERGWGFLEGFAITARLVDQGVVPHFLLPYSAPDFGPLAEPTVEEVRRKLEHGGNRALIPVSYTHLDVYKRQEQGYPVIFICDHHEADDKEFDMFPAHCVAGSPGSQIIPELEVKPGDKIIKKRRYSAFFGTELDLYLREKGVEEIYLVGVCTNICAVSYTHLDVYKRQPLG